MKISFNPSIKTNNPTFKSLKDGFIEAKEVADYTESKILPKLIKMGGAYKPTVDNFHKTLQALEDAKKIAGKDISVGEIIENLDDAKEILTEEARKLKIIK